VSIDRIAEVLSTEEILEIKERVLETDRKGISFEDIDFYYPGSQKGGFGRHHVHVSGKARPKAFIGSTGRR